MRIIDLIFRANTTDLDKAEKKLDQTGNAAEKAEGKLNTLGSAFKQFGGLGGAIGDIADKVEDVGDKADVAATGFKTLSSALGSVGAVAATALGAFALAGVAAATAAVKIALSVADAADKMNDLANRTNISTERLSLFDYAAKQAGSSVEELVSSSEQLGAKLAKQDEESGKVANALKTLGISTKEANGETKSMLQLQEEIVVAASKATNQAEAEGAAITALGTNYYKLRTAILETAEKKREMYDYMKNVGAVTTTQLAKDSDDLNDKISKLGTAFEGMGKSIASAVIPILNRTLDIITQIAEKAAAVIRKYTGNATAVENAQEALRQAEVNYAAAERGAQAATNPDSVFYQRVQDTLKKRAEELASARRNLLKAMEVESAATEAAVSGKTGEGNRPAAGSGVVGKPDKPEKAERPKDMDWWFDAIEERANQMSKRGLFDLKRQDEAEAAADKQAEALQKLIQKYHDMSEPMNQYIREQQEIERLMSEFPQYAEVLWGAWNKVQDKIDEAGKQTKKTSTDMEMLSRIGETAFKGLEDALMDLVTNGKFSFKNFVASILQDLARLIIQMKIIMPMMAAFKAWMGGGSFWGTFFGTATASADGNVFDQGPVMHGFKGGVGVLGEAGPEAVMPLKRTATGQLGVIAQGGSGGGVQVGSISVTVQGGTTNQETGQVVSKAVVDAMKRIAQGEIVNSRRPGGILYA